MGRGEGRVVSRGKHIQLDFYYRGVRCRETLKLAPTARNMKYAQRLMSSILHEIAIGTFSYSKHFPQSRKALLFDDMRAATITVGEALERYLAGLKPSLEHSTWRDYTSAIKYHLKPNFGSQPVRELSTQQVREWIGGLTISAKRINNVMVPLRGMLADMHADGLILRNPMDRIRNLPVRSEAPDPFTPEERGAILAACQETQHPAVSGRESDVGGRADGPRRLGHDPQGLRPLDPRSGPHGRPQDHRHAGARIL